VILDKDKDRVLAVLPDRKAETVSRWFKSRKVCDFSELKSISMDMSDGFIKAVRENFENREDLICFDRYPAPLCVYFEVRLSTPLSHSSAEGGFLIYLSQRSI
jgi:hypothetical protein